MAFSHHRIGFPMISSRFSFSIFGRPLNLANVPKICHPSLGCLRLSEFNACFMCSLPLFHSQDFPNIPTCCYKILTLLLHSSPLGCLKSASGCTNHTFLAPWTPKSALTPIFPATFQVAILQTVNACQVLLHKLDSSQARGETPMGETQDEKRFFSIDPQGAWVVYNVPKVLGDIYICIYIYMYMHIYICIYIYTLYVELIWLFKYTYTSMSWLATFSSPFFQESVVQKMDSQKACRCGGFGCGISDRRFFNSPGQCGQLVEPHHRRLAKPQGTRCGYFM